MENGIYPNSRTRRGGELLYIAGENGVKSLYVCGTGEAYETLEGDVVSRPDADGPVRRCPLTNRNARAIRKMFPFARPSSHRGHSFTLGLGDRLGLASAGHLRLIREM
ncbi:MAG: tagaturonate epimerase family protein, partial [Oscillospiraceae bacterium]|nr:tagaturonate epimerase family protein [Oscillospiraceae bacterium]